MFKVPSLESSPKLLNPNCLSYDQEKMVTSEEIIKENIEKLRIKSLLLKLKMLQQNLLLKKLLSMLK